MDGQGNAVKLSGSPMGKHTIEKHNIWTGVGQGVDLIKLAKAVEALSGNPGSLVYEFTKPRKDWDKVEAAKVAKRDAAISEWVKATEAYAVYTNTTLPAYKAKASAHRSDVAAHKAWTRRGAAYAAWLALTPEEDVDTPMPPQAGTEPAIRVAPEQPEAVGEPGDEPEPKIAAKMPQWLKDWEKGNGHGRVTR